MRVRRALVAILLVGILHLPAWSGEDVLSFDPYHPSGIRLSRKAGNTNFLRLLVDTEHFDEADRYRAAKKGQTLSVSLAGTEFDLNDSGTK